MRSKRAHYGCYWHIDNRECSWTPNTTTTAEDLEDIAVEAQVSSVAVGRGWPDVVGSLLETTKWLPWPLLALAPYVFMMWLDDIEDFGDVGRATAISLVVALVGALAKRFG